MASLPCKNTLCCGDRESKRSVAGSCFTSTKPTCHCLLLAGRKRSWRTALALEVLQLPPPSSETILTSRVGADSAVRISLTQRSFRAVSHRAWRKIQHLCTLCSPLCTAHAMRCEIRSVWVQKAPPGRPGQACSRGKGRWLHPWKPPGDDAHLGLPSPVPQQERAPSGKSLKCHLLGIAPYYTRRRRWVSWKKTVHPSISSHCG